MLGKCAKYLRISVNYLPNSILCSNFVAVMCMRAIRTMIQLRPIQTSDTDYAFVEQLLVSAFPEAERRAQEAQRQNVDSNLLFHCMLAKDDDKPVGLFNYWDFGAFCYCEHFAVDPALRNRGCGSEILRTFFQTMHKPLVLEVEMPDNEVSKRRVAFYQRNGLSLWEGYEYVQPPFRAGGESLPMLLMSSEGLSSETDFWEVKRTLYREVYQVKDMTF